LAQNDSALYASPFLKDPILEMLDSLEKERYFTCNAALTDSCMAVAAEGRPTSIPYYDDLIIEARLAKLDAETPFDLIFNQSVKNYIQLYGYKRRGLVSRMISLANLYFPLFEEKLAKYNLPMEFKYLAIVESALNPNAVSKSGAAGLWQFMYPTGKMFGLDVTSYVDLRRDPLHSTEAACQYFAYLYRMFGDWQMVLAAYNCGPGTLTRAIRRSGGKKTYWEIRPYLPQETQGYVPAFIAVNYVMKYQLQHHIYPLPIKSEYFYSDTILVKQEVSFSQISQVLEIPMEDLRFLNPAYRLQIIPGTEKAMSLRLPADKIGSFLNRESEVYTYKRIEPVLSVDNREFTYSTVKKYHKVRKGESLTVLAKKYGCTIAEIKKWNRIRSSKVNPGKLLVLYVKEKVPVEKPIPPTTVALVDSLGSDSTNTVAAEPAEGDSLVPPLAPNNTASTAKSSAPRTNESRKMVFHTVQKGDTLWKIANKYKISTVDEIMGLNGLKKNYKLVPGTKLKVGYSG
jgi:membrane-bound lytic murein transglycosylase D